ncbi:Uncharacterized protein OS=Isosphaera pallida (strain ATCC 43644 / DSM 9630 / IS1B) GN=Isop_3205 PE=4 SV=1 [Gemmata massiliana]|uniref:Uncharacterized protein n=1 Tax=Gemmata massiliana TaxID=1210884 RepID=A0A6P2DK32_9BACT|nr:hypothetical protein [Gemmata massiliana]VTS02649.1 Uncharacterized protein OS=Isosphaera pallida (strain ATCC 43644 / DSM 9630 / IS1B) GN=Isop_3205 PE=4 SV=1 [Gemmata massiliana]
MRYALTLCVSAFLVAPSATAPVPPPSAREVPHLVEKLGSEDFAEREAATKRLDELGLLALSDLRAATLSENAEIADRAKDLVRKIERRAANDRALAPTLVDLDLKDTPLDAVLAELSKQSGGEVVLSGAKAHELASKKVTIATGKVPFWTAVLRVCDAAELQVAGAGGFFAPGTAPYFARADKKKGDDVVLRVATNPNKAVMLEARDGKKRPASVHGAVLIEAFEVPKVAAPKMVATAVLQVWPEPKLVWQSTADAKVTKATDTEGQKILPDFTRALTRPQVQRFKDGGVAVVRNADGTVTLVNLNATNPIDVGPNFTPNARQAVIKLKTQATTASELIGAVYGLVRSAPEPLVTVPLNADATTVTGLGGSEVTAALRADPKGKQFVDVKLTYDPLRVDPVRTSDELPDVKPEASGNQTVHGLRVTDTDGKAFDASLAKATNEFAGRGQRVVLTMQLELPMTKDGSPAPAKLVFWGHYAKSVEVPFVLKNVPLTGGAK